MRNHRHRKVAHDGQMALRHIVMRGALSMTWVRADIVATNDLGTPKGRLAQSGVPRQSELLERLARSAGDSIEHARFAAVVTYIAVEGTEFGGAQVGRDIRYRLNDAFEVQIAGECFGDAVESF